MRSVDSGLFTTAYGVYNKVVEGYNSDKSTYDTKKTEYETAVEDRKKDPKKTLPTRPNMPSVPAGYSGPKLLLTGQTADPITETWDKKIKEDMTGFEGLLATAAGAYDATKLTSIHANRISYLAASGSNDKTKVTGVGATFGRLGQGLNTQFASTDATPFVWQKDISAARPGMQVSLLPEYVRSTDNLKNANGWNDWTLT